MELRRLKQQRKHEFGRALKWVVVAGVFFVACLAGKSEASSVPDNQQAWLEIRGSGVAPSSKISLVTGGKDSIVTQSDKNGEFVFRKLGYLSFVPLSFRLDIPEYKSDLVVVGGTSLTFDFDPYGSTVEMSGRITPAGSVVINVDGVDSQSQIAGLDGNIHLLLNTPLSLADGVSTVMANIINVGESCCPKVLVPAPPVQLSFSSIAAPDAQSQPAAPTATPIGSSPTTGKAPAYIIPTEPPQQSEPQPSAPEPQKKEQPKKRMPYLVTGSFEQNIVINSQYEVHAIGFPSSEYEDTYVGGFKKLTDQVRDAIVADVLAIGAFLDGRAEMNALGTVQRLNAETVKDYAVSDSICKFGTLSRGLPGTNSLVEANKQAFAKILFDRNTQSKETIFSDATLGAASEANDFKLKYCRGVDSGSALGVYCKSSKAPPEEFFNRDIDFTRGFDVPLTLNINYTDGNNLTDDEEKTLALFHLISREEPQFGANDKLLKKRDKADDFQNLRQNVAVRQLVGNTFANMVAMKAAGTLTSGIYMKNILVKMGLNETDARKLIGNNPSYFAQMEILTKKLYQDPAFFANLYDTPANVARQRVAIKAISLMQDRDFLETLKRREMLLSELLEMRLRKKALEEDVAGITN